MNRRTFLHRLIVGGVATAALVHVPASLVKAVAPDGSRYWAMERMRRVYLEWVNAHPGHWPKAMIVGRDLYELYEQELRAPYRFTTEFEGFKTTLVFKGMPVLPKGSGYGCKAVAVVEYVRNTTEAA